MDVKVKGIIALVLTAFFWGTTFILVKETVSIVPLDGFLSIRFLLAGLVLLIPIFRDPKARKDLKNKWAWIYGVILGILLYASYWAQTEGLTRTTPSKAAFITGISVILVPILGIYPFRLKVSKSEWFSVLLALTGLSLMTLNFANITDINNGDALILVTAVCVAYHILLTPFARNISTITLVGIQMFVISFLATIVAIKRDSLWFPISEPSIVWITLFVTAVLASAFAFLSQTFAQKNGVSTTNVALIFSLEPIFALLIDIMVGVLPSIQGFIGMTLIFTGMIITSFKAINHIKQGI